MSIHCGNKFQRMMVRSICILVGVLSTIWFGHWTAHATAGADGHSAPVSRVIFFIVDGMGFAHVDLARLTLGRPLAFDGFSGPGRVFTAAADNAVTDSAAAATALATGMKTNVGMVSMSTQGQPLVTLLHAAQDEGRGTGIITTTRVTHATPAAFVASATDRKQEDVIAKMLLQTSPDVVFGGGYDVMSPAVPDAEKKGYKIVRTADELARARGPEDKVMGLFAPSHMDYELLREPAVQPSLADMTLFALDYLDRNPHGFFVLVEAGRVDQASHENMTALMLMDMIAFDQTVAATLDWLGERDDVLVVITADHETGGLSFGDEVNAPLLRNLTELFDLPNRILEELQSTPNPDVESVFAPYDVTLDDGYRLVLRRRPSLELVRRVMQQHVGVYWSTVGHTNADVPLYVYGPGAGLFPGELDNTEVALRIAELAGLHISGMDLPRCDTLPTRVPGVPGHTCRL